MTTHYRIPGHYVGLACGRGSHLRYSRDPMEVTCQKCKGTGAWKIGHLVEVGELPDAHEEMRAVLDALFRSAHQAAENAGHCDTYDDIVGEIDIPSWYTIPGRPKTFSINTNLSYVEGMDEDDVYAKIAANPRSYVVITS